MGGYIQVPDRVYVERSLWRLLSFLLNSPHDPDEKNGGILPMFPGHILHRMLAIPECSCMPTPRATYSTLPRALQKSRNKYDHLTTASVNLLNTNKGRHLGSKK